MCVDTTCDNVAVGGTNAPYWKARVRARPMTDSDPVRHRGPQRGKPEREIVLGASSPARLTSGCSTPDARSVSFFRVAANRHGEAHGTQGRHQRLRTHRAELRPRAPGAQGRLRR